MTVAEILFTLGPRACVGGGFLRYAQGLSEELKDIDLLFADPEAVEIATRMLKEADYHLTFESNNAKTWRLAEDLPPVQLVTRWYFSPEEHCKRFDFTIAQCVMWCDGDAWMIFEEERFVEDCQGKRLTYTSPTREEEPLGSLRRALRFSERGYHIHSESLARLVHQMYFTIQKREEDLSDFQVWRGMSLRAGNY